MFPAGFKTVLSIYFPHFYMFFPLLSRTKEWIHAHPRTIRFGAGCSAILFAAFLAFPSHASNPWKWRDLSQQIPSSIQSTLTMVSGRGTDWLASDGSHLWSVNTKEEVTSYSDYVNQYGRVQSIGNDGRSYLIAFSGMSGPSFVKTNLSQWTTASALRFPQRTIRSIQGNGGSWAIMTDDQFNEGSLPKTWQISLWQEGQSTVDTIPLPTAVSAFVPGCKTNPSAGGSICAGNVSFVPLNGSWYLFAGQAETRDGGTHLLQEARTGVWRWDGLSFSKVANAPSARFVSGVWAGNKNILLATSNAVTNPYAADTYWIFNGSTFTPYKTQPLEAGMLSVDTRSVHAAWTGSAWAVVARKTLTQVNNGSFAVEGELRDQVSGIAGSTSGNALLVGKRDSFDAASDQSASPMMAILGASSSSDDAGYLIRPRAGSVNRTEITHVTISGNHSPATIKNGESFTVRASADADSGIKQIDILVNGALITNCNASTCHYTQTYWTNGDEKRRVLFTARATDHLGHVTESQALVLNVRDEPVAETVAQTTDDVGLMPAGLRWQTDASSGIASTSWLIPSSPSPEIIQTNVRTVHVAANAANGIDYIEFWVNGTLNHACRDSEQNGLSFCEVRLTRNDYPATGDVLVNARFVAKDGKETWSPIMRLGW